MKYGLIFSTFFCTLLFLSMFYVTVTFLFSYFLRTVLFSEFCSGIMIDSLACYCLLQLNCLMIDGLCLILTFNRHVHDSTGGIYNVMFVLYVLFDFDAVMICL